MDVISNREEKKEREWLEEQRILPLSKPEPVPTPPLAQQQIELERAVQNLAVPTSRKVSRFEVTTTPNTAIGGPIEESEPALSKSGEQVVAPLTALYPPLSCPVTQVAVQDSNERGEVRNLFSLSQQYVR